MMRPTFTKLSALALMFIITAAIGAVIVQSQGEPERLTISQSAGISAALLAPGTLFIRPCKPRSTIGGRLTRRVDVFGDDEPQYRPVKGEPVFLWNADGDEIARTRTDRSGDYSFPNLCPGTYTVHPGIFSPRLPSRYDPESRMTRVPIRITEVGSPLHLDFVRKQPPPPRQPDFPGAR